MITRVERSKQVRRRRLTVAAAAAAALVLGLIVGAGGDEPDPTRPAAESPSEPGAQATPAPVPVDSLSLEQQVGRMVILRFAGTRAPEYVTRNLREGKVAGVILFRDNVTDPDQLRALTRSLRQASPDVTPFICVDQEGGEVRILPWAAPERAAPEQQAFGTVREDSLAAARDLREAGVNVNLAPVADLPTVEGSVMANRAFTTDPAGLTAAIAEAVAGFREGGVATTVKHFPGLGGATVNTDFGPATVDRTRAQLEDDLRPFIFAVESGTEFVMVGHATYPALDADHIASQSPAVVDGVLRDDIRFEGVVMTDSLEAAAVQEVADVEEAALASARAGVDVILTTGRGSYIRVYRALLAEAERDPEFRARVEESAARVLEAQSSMDG